MSLFTFFDGTVDAASDGGVKTPSATQSPAVASKPETTTDTSALSLERNVLFIRLLKGFYEVREILMFVNKGKKTIVSKDGAPTLRFILPSTSNIRNPQATLTAPIQGLDPKNIRQSGSEIVSTDSIAPGSKLVGLFYRMADEFGGFVAQHPIIYGSPSFAILAEKGRVQLQADGLKPGEPVKFQDGEYDSYVTATRAGSVVRFSLKAPDSAGGLVYFYVALGTIFVLGAGAAVLIRTRRRSGLSQQVEREELIRAIAELDDRLAMNSISAREHENQRIPRFNRLRELSK
ncbi:MAG: hypothetical protein HN435_09985 [Nitrospinaceae bacterium]|nr:hypothetical protein [Nitrospinaceae bacterium]